MEEIIQEFIQDMGEGTFYSEISEEIIKKYKNTFLTDKDTEDIIPYIWKNYGLRSYKDGLFWLVNPDDYNDLARKFPNISDKAIVFARTGVGNLFLMEQGFTGININYLNTHSGQVNLAGRSFKLFFDFYISLDSFWKRDCYGKIELKATKKQALLPDECLTFVPALALGGDEKIANLQKVKIKENLEFLSQLHSK